MTAKISASVDGLSGSLAVGANEAFQFKPVAGGLELSQDGITFQTVDTNGKVTFPQNVAPVVPVFRASLAGAQSFASGVFTKVLHDTIQFNSPILFGNGTWTPNVAGYYQVNACNQLLTNAQGSYGIVEIRKNGSTMCRSESAYVGNVATSYGTLSTGSVVQMNGSTDYLEVWILIVGANPYTGGTEGANNFSGALVRAGI